MDIEKKITQLTNQLQQYAKEYYELDQPTISDEYYDQLYHELLDLEKEYPQFIQPNSPTNKVGFVTKNSNNKQFTYNASRKQLTNPQELTRNGIVYTINYKSSVKAVK